MKGIIFLFILSLTIGIPLKAEQITFKASAPEAVVAGQQFRLSYVVNHADGEEFRLTEEISGFKVLIGPSPARSQSATFNNGKLTSESSLTNTYILVAEKEGTYTLPAATIKVNNATYTSNKPTIKVLPPDQATNAASDRGNATTSGSISNDDVFMVMQVSKRSVYEQEGFLVTFKLYSKDGQVALNALKYPDFEGFLSQEVELPENKQWVQEHYNGRNYLSVVLKQTVLYPQRSGKITIGAGSYPVTVRVYVQSQMRSLFDDFLGSYHDVKKVLTTAPVTIDVNPLPFGKPASYANAVGDYTMTASISSDQVKTNEAVTVKVKISGTGNLRLIKNPEVLFPNDFNAFDPKVENDIKVSGGGVHGSRTIEYVAIPRYAGDFEIPAINFSYFDIKSGAYKTLTSGPYTLHVEKGEGGEAGDAMVSNFSNRERVRYLGQDIRYLKVSTIRFMNKNDIFFGSFTYWMCYLIPFILFILFFFIYRKQVKENANIALVRTKKANKMAVRRLKNAGKLLKENAKEAFYEEVLRALWGYLSDKLNIPQSTLTKDNVETELAKYGVDGSLITEFMEILNTCEFARYAPSQASDAMDQLYASTVDAIGKMENTIKK
ncbi:MAG: BatD family protein [Tannerellaceae bacterium]|jgi:hypothetical protein|nr:BatD family protein [Tannerellaceae bacterium]